MTHTIKVKRKVEVRAIDANRRLSLGAARAAINRAAAEARKADSQDARVHRADRWEVSVVTSHTGMYGNPNQHDMIEVVAERAL